MQRNACPQAYCNAVVYSLMKAETNLNPNFTVFAIVLYAEEGHFVQDPYKRYRRIKNTIKKAQMAILILKLL